MRKHGWQLPYHPLQVVAVDVFLALGFVFYVFFAPFVGNKIHQYIAMGIYSPLSQICGYAISSFNLIHHFRDNNSLSLKHSPFSSLYSICVEDQENRTHKKLDSSQRSSLMRLLCSPCAMLCGCCSGRGESSEQQMSEDGMFYCSLCEVEVFKYSKHCKVYDKCVDSFDHHCRVLNRFA